MVNLFERDMAQGINRIEQIQGGPKLHTKKMKEKRAYSSKHFFPFNTKKSLGE
jgi:hypothetical protein